ncbi:hypothetical protein TH1_20750 [Thalassospira lucentensis MCCC 1A00383 = DSM 14000]|nr:hypothetical protein TH1_20750 [Thalassospira lucentensis MCCC 1A00383 = DSM 14000]
MWIFNNIGKKACTAGHYFRLSTRTVEVRINLKQNNLIIAKVEKMQSIMTSIGKKTLGSLFMSADL